MQTVYRFPLDSRDISIGRDSSNDIVLTAVGVSRVHARIHCDPTAPRITDCASTFGTRVNHQPIVEAALTDGTRVTIGVVDLRVTIVDGTITIERSDAPRGTEEDVGAGQWGGTDTIRIGRDDGNEIALTHPLVSRFHCSVRRISDAKFVIADNNSTNGTFVNGRPVHRAELEDGDVVQVGPYRFILAEGRLVQADDYSRVRLEAYGVCVRRGGQVILDNVSLSIPPGEFVAILGPSGAGKTTLAQALTGQVPVDRGDVYYNGFPLRRFLAAFNASIGFVSQHNLLHPELTVWETLWEQSVLRLPRDSLNAERVGRIESVMQFLEISHLAKRRISRLSGGEAKRVHVGVELLSSPTVLFLDEPLAGLDPGLVHKFMQVFKSLCDRGHTLLLTTHTLEQIDLCGRILFVNNGRVVFEGTPSQARQSLSVGSLAEMYEKIRAEKVPGIGLGGTGGGVTGPHPAAEGMASQYAPLYRPRAASALRQFGMLIKRYTRVLVRDYRNIGLILVQSPLIALLLGLVFDTGADFLPLSFYFCVTISVIWMGGVNSIREVAREWDFFRREFRVGLRTISFAAAKTAVLGVLSVVQALLFCVVLRGLFGAFVLDAGVLALSAAGCVSGSLLGLCVSAFSGNVGRAISLLPIVFIPQIFLSGILIPFDRMPAAGRFLSHLTLSRPVFSMFKKACLLNLDMTTLTEWRPLAALSFGLIILTYLRIRWHYFFSKTG